MYELKKGREGGRKERMKREEGKKRMPLENAPIIAWDFPGALQSHFHCGIETGIKVWSSGRRGLISSGFLLGLGWVKFSFCSQKLVGTWRNPEALGYLNLRLQDQLTGLLCPYCALGLSSRVQKGLLHVQGCRSWPNPFFGQRPGILCHIPGVCPQFPVCQSSHHRCPDTSPTSLDISMTAASERSAWRLKIGAYYAVGLISWDRSCRLYFLVVAYVFTESLFPTSYLETNCWRYSVCIDPDSHLTSQAYFRLIWWVVRVLLIPSSIQGSGWNSVPYSSSIFSYLYLPFLITVL